MSHPLDTTLGPMAPFVSKLLLELAHSGVTIRQPRVDHLCYRAATLQEYCTLCTTLSGFGTLLVEGMIGGRPIATYQLLQPLLVDEVHVPCIELVAPKPSRHHQTGLEHIELVVASLDELLAHYPNLPFKTGNIQDPRNPDISLILPSGQIKFHLRPLSEVIAEEVATGAVVAVPADYFMQDEPSV